VNYPKRIEELEINPADDGFIIYQPDRDRVHYLNHTAVVILELCTGLNSPAEIANMVQEVFKLNHLPQEEVEDMLAMMKGEGLVVNS